MTPVGEQLLQTAYKSKLPYLPSAAQRFFPQPAQYSKATVRRVERDGAMWELRPAHFFQWARYFNIDDPVKRVLFALAGRCRTIIDVGANVGYYSVCLARAVGPEGRLLAIEPHEESFRQLNLHCRMNQVSNVVAVQCAVSDEPGEAMLRDQGVGDLGKFSLRTPDAGPASNDAHSVHVDTIDRLCQAHGLSPVDLMKVDVEGYEPEALLGAREILHRDKPFLVLEWSPHWHQALEKREQCIRLLEECGYDRWKPLGEAGSAEVTGGLNALRLASELEGQSNWLAWAEPTRGAELGTR